jgi:hypothetical protein
MLDVEPTALVMSCTVVIEPHTGAKAALPGAGGDYRVRRQQLRAYLDGGSALIELPGEQSSAAN